MDNDKKLTKKEFEKERADAVQQIISLLNKYNLTIITEHTIAFAPKETLKQGNYYGKKN